MIPRANTVLSHKPIDFEKSTRLKSGTVYVGLIKFKSKNERLRSWTETDIPQVDYQPQPQILIGAKLYIIFTPMQAFKRLGY
ncbi:hypothetical protein BCU70_10460 [Vibrio sp. 10N.286.49.C2]|nr:hypothetical protein BCU70_10460 [Vibrio sp. 10N.286.49.C2]PMH48951.1 hypothetical protein BCU66_21065 [Vibrio sp. 10N.286.49.B1]PMH82112.1 hypothetical protein BCU58_19230 [Vibrio sp. 10N.286.48.B7]